MGTTSIEWTATKLKDGTWVPGYSFNPWVGCTKVSPACDNCYAESWAKRSGMVQWGHHPRRRTSERYWKEPEKWNARAARDGVRRKVFCASLADVFDNQVDIGWRQDLCRLIFNTPALDWLLLTKRPQNVLPMLGGCSFPDNVWLGTTVENQGEAERRIPHLLAVPEVIRFVSAEPLLGSLTLQNIQIGERVLDALRGQSWRWGAEGVRHDLVSDGPRVHWVIGGGESGPHARPSHPDWFRRLQKQCEFAHVPYFHKQNGAWHEYPGEAVGRDIDIVYPDGRVCNTTLPAIPPSGERHSDGGVCMVKVGKKAAGALLDGRGYREFPQ